MQPLFAILGLTWRAAFRYRLFWVILILLLAAVVGLPLVVKDDGTADGFAQILITYTLSAVTGLLGMSTLWLACGTLARDMEECQIQMLAVKPIARWKIWLGKWLGIVTLNAALLAVAGLAVFLLLEFRGNKLVETERFKLFNEVLVARDSLKEEDQMPLIQQVTERIFKEQLDKNKFVDMDLNMVRKQLFLQVKAERQVVAPGGTRVWKIKLGSAKDSLKDQPLYLRIKFSTPQTAAAGATYYGQWAAGTPGKTRIWQTPEPVSMAPDTFHEFQIDPNVFDENGDLTILFGNVSDTSLLFQLDDGLEILYRVGGFGGNFVRGLAIILFWMSLLAALGLAASSLMSFPVAAFFSLALLFICLSSGTMSSAVEQRTIMGGDGEGGSGHSSADKVVIPAFEGMLYIINLVEDFSPIDSLSTGRVITWKVMGLAFGQIVLLMGGTLGLTGMLILTNRELATAQKNN